MMKQLLSAFLLAISACLAHAQPASNIVNLGQTTRTLSGWTSGTSQNATQTLTLNGGPAATLVQLVQGTTISAGAVTFRGSYDGTTFVDVPLAYIFFPNLGPCVSATNAYTLVANTNQPFLIFGGYQVLQIKLTTAITGSGTITPYVTLLNYKPFDPALCNPLVAGSAILGKVGIDQTTLGTTNAVVSAGVGYETIAASQTSQVMGGSGATGDYLSHCIVTPGTTSPGVVTILDNSTAIVSFAGGASSVSNLVPFTIPVMAISQSGAWKITTGANVTVVCIGKFT